MDRRREVEEIALTFIRAIRLSLTATASEADDSIQLDLAGPDSYLLLERKGSVLDALQLLMGKVAEQRLGIEKRLVIDCDGFRRGREQELVETARRLADKVRKLQQPLELPPLNSYERRLVHIALKEEQGITAESVGDGLIKVIVISPA